MKLLLNNKLPVVLGILAVLLGLKAYNTLKPKSDLRAASVKIVNRAMSSGGTGIILSSSTSESSILTNDHVCRLVKKAGGLVLTANGGQYQATSIIESEVSDLCLLQVSDDLGVDTTVSSKAPKMYDSATVSGHPALMPNVLSSGHVSGRAIIQVMTGMRPCTEAEAANPDTMMICMFFGGLPVVKSYESVLVTATIMPGSSGSGVYNKNKELSGVVFAGSTEFGYAWTVPYEQVLNFLNREHTHLTKQNLSQEIDIFGSQDDSKKMKEVLQKCSSATDDQILNFCAIIKRDVIWRQ